MKQSHIVVALIAILFFTIIISRQGPNSIYSEVYCDPMMSICAACPASKQYGEVNPLTRNTRITYFNNFYVLATSKKLILKNNCKEILDLIKKSDNGVWRLSEQVETDIRLKESYFIKAEMVQLGTVRQYSQILSNYKDFVLFYEGIDVRHPIIQQQHQSNHLKLMKLARSVSWGMIFALLLKSLDSRIGLISSQRIYKFPLFELLILCYMLYISYDSITFGYIYIAQLMFLTYIIIKFQISNRIFIVFAIFIILSVLGESFLFIADILWLLHMKFQLPGCYKVSQKYKILLTIILMSLIINVMIFIGNLNYLIYASYAYKVISIPISLIIFQSEWLEKRVDSTAQRYLSRA